MYIKHYQGPQTWQAARIRLNFFQNNFRKYSGYQAIDYSILDPGFRSFGVVCKFLLPPRPPDSRVCESSAQPHA